MYGRASTSASEFWEDERLAGIGGGAWREGKRNSNGNEKAPEDLLGSPEPEGLPRIAAGGGYWIATLRPVTAAFFGSVSSSTPSVSLATAFVSSRSCGSAKRRAVLPKVRSRRRYFSPSFLSSRRV